MTLSVDDIVGLGPVIPVVVIDDARTAVPMADALLKGGVKVIEVTLRTPAALDAIGEIANQVPDAVIGAGTVLTPGQMTEAVGRGAQFVVTPGTTDRLIDAAVKNNIAFLPGTATASEVIRQLERGQQFMKFFPAEPAGGVDYLKALSSPLQDAKFCPTGGISMANARDYLALPNVVCVGGSWLVPKDAVRDGNWQRITELAQEASALER